MPINQDGKCQVKTGIFVIKECGEPAAVNCAECGIFVCGKHGEQYGSQLLCTECFAKQPDAQSLRNDDGFLHNYTSNYGLWYFTMRSNFYSSYHYRPFDSHDYNNFNYEETGLNEFLDDQDTGDFFDS